VSDIKWKFVEDPPYQMAGDDVFYALANGYLKPEELLADAEQLQLVERAEDVLSSFFAALEDEGIWEGM
jgi:hypothetical protein